MQQFLAALSEWWKAPFKTQDALHVFLLTGLVLVSIVLWMILLSHLRNVKLSG